MSNLNISSLDFSLGISCLLKNKGGAKILFEDYSQYNTENTIIVVDSKLLSFYEHIGIGFNFNIDLTINWNYINLFYVGVGGMYSNAKFTNLPVTITENGKSSIYRFAGTPSKLSIQISRDINFKKKAHNHKQAQSR